MKRWTKEEGKVACIPKKGKEKITYAGGVSGYGESLSHFVCSRWFL